jgi:NTP pyrophosphatase (non-canonical NTP hydrolase)
MEMSNKIVNHDMSVRHELLQLLQEECAEVIRAASKIIRFGETAENMEHLAEELGDLQAVTTLMHDHDMFSWTSVDAYGDKKMDKLKVYSNIFAE